MKLNDIATDAKQVVEQAVEQVAKTELLDKEQQLTDKAVDVVSDAVEAVVEQQTRNILKRLFSWLAKRLSK